MKINQPETTVQACPRIAVSKVRELLDDHFLEVLEQNQKLASCCRHPENHEISAWKSKPSEPVPDIYIFHCMDPDCGRQHRRFMVGQGDIRPVWEVR